MAEPSSNTNVDIEYVYQVVYDLRPNELQQILKDVKQSPSGSIQLLRNRVLCFLTDPRLKPINMEQKILEVYNTRLRQNQLSQQFQLPPPEFLQEPRYNLQIHSQSYTPPRPNPIQPSIQPFVETSSPAIQFEPIPFFKTVLTLLNPMYYNTDSAKISGIFYLTENVRLAIANSWNSARQEYKIQIILRLLQVGRNTNVPDRLPYDLTVSVNDRQCKLPTLNIPTKIGIASWRSNVPIDITQQTILNTFVKNTLDISWSNELHNYMIGVFLAHKLTSNDLLEELKKRPVRASDKTKELIKKSMENDADMGVDYIYTTVKDPLTKLRMKLPARGVDCIHLQCFDAIQFLQMNEQREKWTCPLCTKKIKFENIEVDEFFLNMLQSPDLSEECENVLLLKDGTWSDGKNKEFSNNSKTNNNGSTNNIPVFTLSDHDDDSDDTDDTDDTDNSESDIDNVGKAEIIPKPKRFKYNSSKEGESEHGMGTEDLTNPSESYRSDKSNNGGTSCPLISLNRMESSTLSNNVNHQNISISGSNNCVAGSSGNSRNNRHQEKDNSKSVLCVITLD
ncbi:unnamed protein product [Macrosiphum euphorbiae]|uniref:Uncharacterized protein n=1 Tax=Macrosiphum euphorbiae TaxID=13131 RepID=A0AAV0XZP3_9HEMI|nr:unnamed protein product [Macrosiphum euphorbiae]